MTIGQLRHRVMLQERDTRVDDFGQPMNAWVDVGKVWASVIPLNAREIIAASAVNATATHDVTIRYQVRFDDPMAMAKRRILMGGRVLNIDGSTDKEDTRRYLVLRCTEGMSDV